MVLLFGLSVSPRMFLSAFLSGYFESYGFMATSTSQEVIITLSNGEVLTAIASVGG